MAGSMGFTDIAELTHKMENVLDKFRNDELQVDSNIITILFKCLDTLESMIENIREESNDIIDISDLMNLLDNIGKDELIAKKYEDKKTVDFVLNEFDKNIVNQANERNYNVYIAEVILSKDCLLKSARAFLVYKTIEDIGEIVKTIPAVDDLEQEKFEDRFNIMFLTQKQEEEIIKLITSISEIEKVNISSLKGEETKSEQNINNKVSSEEQNKKEETKTIKNKEEEKIKRRINQLELI